MSTQSYDREDYYAPPPRQNPSYDERAGDAKRMKPDEHMTSSTGAHNFEDKQRSPASVAAVLKGLSQVLR